MAEQYIAYAVPVFVLLILVELGVNALRGLPVLRFEDAVTNLSCGIGQQMVGLLCKAVVAVAYVALFTHGRLLELAADAWWVWVLALLAVDFCYYWFHRAAHRINFLWATHVVHHQSEEYNLSVALRQSWFASLVGWVFYLPCALIGIPPLVFVVANTVITLYQFWIHTESIRSLGPLEWIFNTPSHHRVHHGINPSCIDTNYAGMLIIWDRLFGSFVPEDEEVVYGTVKPLSSWNPWWANVEYWVHMVRLARQCPRWIDALKVPFMPPEWRPAELGGAVTIPQVSSASRPKYETRASLSLRIYVGVNFVLTLAATTGLLLVHGSLSPAELGVAISLAMLALLTFGGIFEGKRWALGLELLRLGATAAGLGYWVGVATPILTAVATVPAVCMAVWLLSSRQHFGFTPRAAAVPAPPESLVAL